MSWEQVSPGSYERDCDATERFVKYVGESVSAFNREHWTVNTIARVHLDGAVEKDIIAYVRGAWIHLRYNHPFIATVLDGTRLAYQVPDGPALEKWLAESFFIETARTVDDFLIHVRPTAYSSIHYFPENSVILMRTHHWLIDGIGSLNLMNKFLTLLSTTEPNPSFGDEWKRLPPSFTQAAGFSTEDSPAADQDAQKMFMNFIGNLPSIGLPIETPSQGVGGTRHIKLEYSAATGNSLIAACKQHGFSVASAVHAAIVVATQEMAAPSPLAKNYTSVASYNYRPYVQAPNDDADAWPMGCYMLGLPFTLPPADFVTHAREIHKVYHQPLQRGETPVFEAYDRFCSKMTLALSQPPPPGMPLPTQPQLSSLGKVDSRLQAIYVGKHTVSLLDIEVVVDQMTPSIVLYQWSWGGRFFMSAVFNEAFYQEDYVEKFLKRVQDILFQEMTVKVDG